MPNVHGLLFEGFAKHKLVMRSSHRWDHGTPYYSAYPFDDSLDWIRPALRKVVQSIARVSVATEWDYWYSRCVQHLNNRQRFVLDRFACLVHFWFCFTCCPFLASQVPLLRRSREAAVEHAVHLFIFSCIFVQISEFSVPIMERLQRGRQ
jgi:hypothetical protein